MRIAGKFLELIGMVVVLSGLLFGFQFSLVKFELGALLIGTAIFYCGWMLEKKES